MISLLVAGRFKGYAKAVGEFEIYSSSEIFSNPVCSIDLISPFRVFESLEFHQLDLLRDVFDSYILVESVHISLDDENHD